MTERWDAVPDPPVTGHTDTLSRLWKRLLVVAGLLGNAVVRGVSNTACGAKFTRNPRSKVL